MLLNVNNLGPEPPHRQVARQVRSRILERELGPGSLLWPPRMLARQQRLSVSTIERAYRELLDEGVIASRDGRAFVVRDLSPREEQAQRVGDLLAEGPARRLLEDDLVLARDIQSALLPRTLPRDLQLEIAARSLASRVLTGDFYDYVPIDSHRFGLALGDAAGKGLPAALLGSQVQALLKAGFHQGLPQVLATLNDHLLGLGEKARCVTLFCGVYDRSSGRLRYVNAGHNPPLVVRRDGTLELLETGGVLLGAFPGATYAVGTAELRSGDCLLAYSDGLTESFGPEGELYGEQRVREALLRVRGLRADEILRALEADVSAFRGSRAAQDDLTLLLLKKA
jgi:sigma-B regulation protein RsbU (phosphoserine phosphatase)